MRFGMFALAALCGSMIVYCSVAQDTKPTDVKKPEDPAPPVKGTLPVHYKALGLDDKQKAAVYKVQAEYHARIEALQKQIADLKAEEKSKAYELLTDAQKARLKEILTKDATEPPARDLKDPTAPPKDK